MRFKFPLQKVMQHRKIKENLAQKEYQETAQALWREEEKLKKMQDDLSLAFLQSGQLQSQGGNQTSALQQISDFIRAQKVLVQRQEAKVQEFVKLVESKQEILRQAAIDYKIIEKLRGKKFEEYKHDRLMTEQKEMDEQSILRFETEEDKEQWQ